MKIKFTYQNHIKFGFVKLQEQLKKKREERREERVAPVIRREVAAKSFAKRR